MRHVAPRQYAIPKIMNPKILDQLDALHAWLWRHRWPIRLALAVILLACFGRSTYRRLVTPPADPNAINRLMNYGPSRHPPADPAAMPLVAALNHLPAMPTIAAPTTAPAGMKWKQVGSATPGPAWFGPIGPDITVGFAGAWTPKTRYALQQVATYLENPKVTAVLKDIERLVRQPVQLPAGTNGLGTFSKIRQACKILVLRARYLMAGKHDVAGACCDIETALQLAEARRTQGH